MSVKIKIKTLLEGFIELCRRDDFDAGIDTRVAKVGDTMTGTLEAPEFTVGGSPVVDSGSNANGNWVKYYDGTLIQYIRRTEIGVTQTNATGSIFYGDTAAYAYPVAFVGAAPIISTDVNAAGNVNIWTRALLPSITATQLRIFSSISITQNVTFDIIAMGAWK